MDRQRIQHALAGPVPSLRIPFDADGSIDLAALRKMVEFDVAAGSQALILTAGDSLFPLLTEREIGEVTKTVVDQSRGRAVVAACTGHWNTLKCAEFARYCREIGADVLMLLGSTWYPECLSVETMIGHHAAVGQHIPVMVNTSYLFALGKAKGLEALQRLVTEVDEIVAAKCDVTGEFDRKAVLLAKHKWTLFSGGTKQFHMELYPYGCQGQMSAFMTFQPEVTRQYWRAIETGDLAAAVKVIQNYDYPFFDFTRALPGGFDAGIHAVYELYGLAKRWRRKPFTSLCDEDMSRLKEFLAGLRLI